MFRVQLMGEMDVHLIDMGSITQSMDDSTPETKSMSKFKDYISSKELQADSLKSMCPRIWSARACAKDTLLYVPTGYMIVEAVSKGPLCYGVRKSFFLKSSKSQ